MRVGDPGSFSVATVRIGRRVGAQLRHVVIDSTGLGVHSVGAVAWPLLADGQPHPRITILDAIKQRGCKAWKQQNGYHRRSLAETALFRFKTLFGGRLKNHCFEA